MRTEHTIVVTLLACSAFVQAVKLPTWIVPCFRDDPMFNACAVKNGREAIPRLVKGDRKFRVPVLDPLEVTELHVDKDSTRIGIDMKLKDIKLTGLAQSQLRDYRVDFEKRHISFINFVPRINLLSSYSISGQILILPIVGHGPSNITLLKTFFNYGVDYDLEKRKDGKDYITLKNSKVTFNTTKAYIRLENLFNGNKLLGDNMNIFLEENWEEMIREVGPAVSDALEGVIRQVFTQLADVIPFEEVHPLKPRVGGSPAVPSESSQENSS